MSLVLKPMGKITVIPTNQYEVACGPVGKRTATELRSVTWECSLFNATSRWANGTYLAGTTGIAEPEIRIMFETDRGEFLYVEYIARIDLAKHATGKVPGPLSTGRVETDAERLLWLNETAIVGDGLFTIGKNSMSMVYSVYALDRVD